MLKVLLRAASVVAIAAAVAACTRQTVFSDGLGGRTSESLSVQSEELLARRVLRLTRPGTTDSPALGSAVLLDDGTVLTSLHNLPPVSYGYRVEIEGRWVQLAPGWVPGFELAGRPVALRLIAKGGDTPQEMEGDWARLEVKPVSGSWPLPGRDGIKIQLGEPPSPGTRVLMVGFWSPSGDLMPSSPTFIHGIVGCGDEFSLSDGVFAIHSDQVNTTLEGTSGGEIATIDPTDGSVTIVGIYRGMRIANRGASEVGRVHLGVIPRLDR